MCRLKIFFCNFGLVVKLAPLAVKAVFACYHCADYLSTVKPNPHIQQALGPRSIMNCG
jgi:hypothetical protein